MGPRAALIFPKFPPASPCGSKYACNSAHSHDSAQQRLHSRDCNRDAYTYIVLYIHIACVLECHLPRASFARAFTPKLSCSGWPPSEHVKLRVWHQRAPLGENVPRRLCRARKCQWHCYRACHFKAWHQRAALGENVPRSSRRANMC